MNIAKEYRLSRSKKLNIRALCLFTFSVCIILLSSCYRTKKEQKVHLSPDCFQFDVIDSLSLVREVENAHLAFPDIVRCNNGRLILVYREGEGHVEPSGRIVAQWSDDKGKTWSEPRTIINTPGVDDRDPSISLGTDGMLHLVFFRYVRNQSENLPRAISQVYYSVGNPETIEFSEPIKLGFDSLVLTDANISDSIFWSYPDGNSIYTRAVSAKAVESNGEWVVPIYGGNPAVIDTAGNWISPASRISIFRSEGAKWTEYMVNQELLKKVWLQEPCILIIHDSLWVMHIRTARGSKPFGKGMMAQSFSYDAGKTWTAWYYLGFYGHAPYLHKCSNGLIISAFRWLDEEFESATTAFMWSADSCITWSDVRFIEAPAAWDCSYPSIQEVGTDSLLFVFYSENGSKIKSSLYHVKQKDVQK